MYVKSRAQRPFLRKHKHKKIVRSEMYVKRNPEQLCSLTNMSSLTQWLFTWLLYDDSLSDDFWIPNQANPSQNTEGLAMWNVLKFLYSVSSSRNSSELESNHKRSISQIIEEGTLPQGGKHEDNEGWKPNRLSFKILCRSGREWWILCIGWSSVFDPL